MKIRITFLMLSGIFILNLSLDAQVYTRILSENEKISDFFPFVFDDLTEYYPQPDIDFNRVLEQDRKEGNTLYRVSVKVDQNYTIEDGFWTEYSDVLIWQIGFSAPNSSSLNFLLTDLSLPDDSEMYMISKDNKIIHGPILTEHIYDGAYSSDIIEATDVRIIVKTSLSSYHDFL